MAEDQTKWLERLVAHVRFPVDDPRFLDQMYEIVEREREGGTPLEESLSMPLLTLSYQIDGSGVQDSAAARVRRRSLRLAKILITEEGSLDQSLLQQAVETLSAHLYSIGTERHYDTPAQWHMLRVLQWLVDDSRLRHQLTTIDPPTSNFAAQRLICDTLGVPENTRVTDSGTRRAILAAWLTYLRQTVGSCFATAPAIVVHQEQPWQFLRDIEELLTTGRLHRTFGGVAYSVPLSPSAGMGDLLAPLILRPGPTALSHSPGLRAAFIAGGLLDPTLPEGKQVERVALILRTIGRDLDDPITTPNHLLRLALLQAVGITEREMREVALRVEQIEPTMGLMHPPSTKGGLAAKVDEFEQRYAAAVAAFRGLTDNALLRSWEYTLASFADVKADFSRWNLYTGLGFDPDEPHGLGATIRDVLQGQLDESNAASQTLYEKYEILRSAIQQIEMRMERAPEEEYRWLRIDYEQKVGDFHTVREELQAQREKGERLANLFRQLVDTYHRLFPDYFQEVYDPELQALSFSRFDDSPAGFRLLYKHGRANSALWTLIYTPDDFVRYLGEFFVATEVALKGEVPELEQEISSLVTTLISRVREPIFLEAALDRVARARNVRKEEAMTATPWAYVSGGSMTTLVSAYFGREERPALKERTPRNPQDLLHFCLETLKELPSQVTEQFLKDPNRSMLMQSPSHAFCLKPGWKPFQQGWLDSGNTASWIRQKVTRPQHAFWELQELSSQTISNLLQILAATLPPALRYSLAQAFDPLPFRQIGAIEFRNYLIETIQRHPWGQHSSLRAGAIDGLLYTHLPYCVHLHDAVREVIDHLFPEDSTASRHALLAFELFTKRYKARPVSALQLQQIIQSILLASSSRSLFSNDLSHKIRKAMRKQQLAAPAPLLVADTNWSGERFGFLVSPGSGQLNLWRSDPLGIRARPMDEWRGWLDGSQPHPWAIFIQPGEYTAVR